MTYKILVIDNLFDPNIKGKIANGAQKFTRNQFALLNKLGETFYITAAGSDPQFANQFILKERFDVNIPEKKDKILQTKRIGQEIVDIINKVKPDVVLDSSCKHMSGIWANYPAGVIFEHYHSPSMPLNDQVKEKFTKKGVLWCGVSRWQNQKNFRGLFDDTINIHYIDEKPEDVLPAEEYGIFVGRWDGGKSPHVALKNYLKSGCKYPVKCFIKFGGQEIPQKELDNLMKSELLEFHIDAPRHQILDAMSKAAFGLGMGNESTGIVCLEYATHGVPYIVTGRGEVAEAEHLPVEALFLNDRNSDIPIPEQIATNVDLCVRQGYDYRKQLSQYVIERYNADHFRGEHLIVIERAINEFAKGTLDAFI